LTVGSSGGKLGVVTTRQSSNQKSPPKSTFNPEAELLTGLSGRGRAEAQSAIRSGEEYVIAAGAWARRIKAEHEELRALRLKRIGGSVYRRKGSRFWQIQYPIDGKLRQESAHTESKHDAEALLREKGYLASAGKLPGTASLEQVIDARVDDARVRGHKAVARLAGAAKALKARLEGYRAEDCNYAVWLKYANDREHQDGRAGDTVNLELSVARSAFKLAHRNGLVSKVPDFPHIKPRVRSGFVDPPVWDRLRAQLRPDFADAAAFAFYTGAREMEVLTLKWSAVERDAMVIHLDETKAGKPRAIPYANYRELREVIERRLAVREQLNRAAVLSRYVFCFRAPVIVRGRRYHAAGDPLFKTTGQRGLLALLRDEWVAAANNVGLPGLLFHDLRRSAARNFERAGIPRSLAMKLGGWTDTIYSRYAIGAESEIAGMTARLSEYFKRWNLHSFDTGVEKPMKSRGLVAEGGRSRTFRRTQCPPGRF